MKTASPPLIAIVLLLTCILLADIERATGASGPVSVHKKQGLYYEVSVDFKGVSHARVGELLAREIQREMPDYQVVADSLLRDQFDLLKAHGLGPDFPEALTRARSLLKNVPPEYVQEIEGMATVFNEDADVLGDGKFSKDELLVLQLFQDVLRPTQCSASAAFGSSSVSGKTILGRNLDWDALPHNDTSRLHAVTTLKKGKRTVTMIHFLGMLTPTSGFNNDRVFGAFLDAETGAAYPSDLAGRRSYSFDFRCALENQSTLPGVVGFLKSKEYAFNHLLFLADVNSAQVLEENMSSKGRGVRGATSPLRPGVVWGIPQVVATVNDFRLPGNFVEEPPSPADTKRWNSFRTLYKNHLARGKIDVAAMKSIAGFSGTDGNAHTSGALFLSNKIVTVQSMVLRMDTLELWVAFAPARSGPLPLNPQYVRVGTPLETAKPK